MRHFVAVLVILCGLFATPVASYAQSESPAAIAEAVRSDLIQAQIALSSDPQAAQNHLDSAYGHYQSGLAASISKLAPSIHQQISTGFTHAGAAIGNGDGVAFAAARAEIWTALLAAGYSATQQALRAGDGNMAQQWLTLREYRTATRFTRPNADATLAIARFRAGQASQDEALQAFSADLLDTYQARLTEALGDLVAADQEQFASRRAEFGTLAAGYFAILVPAYAEQRGNAALTTATEQFSALQIASLTGQPISPPLTNVEAALQGFRAAPLNVAEQTRRAGQLLRFLSLVPVEYDRGVSSGQVTKDLEIREAITFHEGAAAAFADLRSVLEARDPAKTAQVADLLGATEQQLIATGKQTSITDPSQIDSATAQTISLLREIMPPEWQKNNSSADFDVIQTALDQMINAVTAGDYVLAESARLEAYAILESGPEAKLIAFAPQYTPVLEGLFWNGHAEAAGLATLIERNAPVNEIKATRILLNQQLAESEKALGGNNNAPAAVISNAAILVFREGLEAVLILASLLGSLKIGEQRRFRAPLWWGVALAFAATILTWILAQGVLTALARYGERLEAVVSLIAIGVLLLITNWFFHDVYWKGWMSNFHQQKKRILIGGVLGQMIGLMVLGFTSVYREGFETVIFLQALVLESGANIVLGGVALGLLATFMVGVLVFAVQAKLPHKKMLIFTGVLIVVVLVQMVGHTTHVMQVVGWLPTSPIRWLAPLLPYWIGLWFGLYATWEGLACQAAAGVFTIGSYFVAEAMQKQARGYTLPA
jgi:high-affinity iron transporter